MKKSLLVSFVLAGVLISCGFDSDKDSFSIGDDFIKSQTTLSVIDSFTVNLSTVILDSIATSGKGIILAGKLTDNELGKLTSTGFFEIGSLSSINYEKNDRYDSLMLVLNYNSVSYGDTTQKQTLEVYRLTEELSPDDYGSLYNKSSFEYDPTPVGKLFFTPMPASKRKLQIRLSDVLGKEIFALMNDDSEVLTSSEKFREYFKGLVLAPGSPSTAILEFPADTSVKVVLHSHRLKLEKEEIRHVFSLASKETQFNRFVADRTGTPLANIKKRQEEIPAALSSQKSFIQSGVGLLTRVDFPSMHRIIETDRDYLLIKAELILIPEPGSYNKVKLPTQLVMYHSDKSNQIVSEIVGNDQSVIAAEYRVDNAYHENTWYKFDITNFLNTELSDSYFDTDHGLLIGETSTKLGSSLNRAIICDRKNSACRPVVRLYFMYYNL